MSDLKTQLIRLGNANPELREDIKPVLAALRDYNPTQWAGSLYRTEYDRNKAVLYDWVTAGGMNSNQEALEYLSEGMRSNLAEMTSAWDLHEDTVAYLRENWRELSRDVSRQLSKRSSASSGRTARSTTREEHLETVRRALKTVSDFRGRYVDAYLRGPNVILATYRVEMEQGGELQFIHDLDRARQDEKKLARLLDRKGVPVHKLEITPGREGEMEVALHLDTTKLVDPDLSVYGSLNIEADALGQIRQLGGKLRKGGSAFVEAVMQQNPRKMRQQAYTLTYAMGVMFSALGMSDEARLLKDVARALR